MPNPSQASLRHGVGVGESKAKALYVSALNTITIKAPAQKIKMTPQNISWIFSVQDDCFLSVLYRIMEALNVECSVSIGEKKERQQRPTVQGYNYKFKGNLVIADTKTQPDYIIDCPQDAKLRFLADAIEASKLSIADFCQKTNLYRPSLITFFRRDDIKISFICQIADALGKGICWELDEKKADAQA